MTAWAERNQDGLLSGEEKAELDPFSSKLATCSPLLHRKPEWALKVKRAK